MSYKEEHVIVMRLHSTLVIQEIIQLKVCYPKRGGKKDLGKAWGANNLIVLIKEVALKEIRLECLGSSAY